MTPELDGLLSVPIGDDLGQPVDHLRALGRQIQEWETAVSLTRRLTQGRLDMLGYESRRRAGTAPEQGVGLLFDLPDILAESSGGSTGRAMGLHASDRCAGELAGLLDQIASQGQVCRPDALADDQLDALIRDLNGFEQQLSDVRRGLHARLDNLHHEIGRRYRDGEVSVDSLLR